MKYSTRTPPPPSHTHTHTHTHKHEHMCAQTCKYTVTHTHTHTLDTLYMKYFVVINMKLWLSWYGDIQNHYFDGRDLILKNWKKRRYCSFGHGWHLKPVLKMLTFAPECSCMTFISSHTCVKFAVLQLVSFMCFCIIFIWQELHLSN